MVRVKNKFVHTAPRKVRLVLDEIRGRNALVSEGRLRLTSTQAARDVYASLHSAIASAKEQGLETEHLIIAEAFCNEGPRLKRRIVGSRGRANPITKQLSHIHISLDVRAVTAKES